MAVRELGARITILDADGNEIDSTHPLYVAIAAGDIQIGAVEIKDGTTDARAVVGTAAPGAGDAGLVVRPVVLLGAGTAAAAQRGTLASDDPAVVALQIIDDWDESDRAKVNLIVGQAGIAAGAGNVAATVPRVTLAADDPLVAKIGASIVVDVTLTLDTNAYIDGDVLSDAAEVANAARIAAGTTFLKSVTVLDEDDQGAALDLIFLDANQSLGTKNAAPDITDENARKIVGRVSIAAGDFYDLGAARVAVVDAAGLLMKAASAQTSLWVAAISRGTGTYTANGIRLKLAFARD